MRNYEWMTIGLVALVTVLAACGTPDEAVDLEGTEWVLSSLNGESPLHGPQMTLLGTQITLGFEDGVAGGFGAAMLTVAHTAATGMRYRSMRSPAPRRPAWSRKVLWNRNRPT